MLLQSGPFSPCALPGRRGLDTDMRTSPSVARIFRNAHSYSELYETFSVFIDPANRLVNWTQSLVFRGRVATCV